jgi:hypothetical protein
MSSVSGHFFSPNVVHPKEYCERKRTHEVIFRHCLFVWSLFSWAKEEFDNWRLPLKPPQLKWLETLFHRDTARSLVNHTPHAKYAQEQNLPTQLLLYTPLIAMATRDPRHLPVLTMLLRHGARIDATNAAGDTYMHLLIRQGAIKTIIAVFSEFQLNACDFTQRNLAGSSVMDHAKVWRYLDFSPDQSVLSVVTTMYNRWNRCILALLDKTPLIPDLAHIVFQYLDSRPVLSKKQRAMIRKPLAPRKQLMSRTYIGPALTNEARHVALAKEVRDHFAWNHDTVGEERTLRALALLAQLKARGVRDIKSQDDGPR